MTMPSEQIKMQLCPYFETQNYVVITIHGQLVHETLRHFRDQLYKILMTFEGKIVHLCCRGLEEIDMLGVGCFLYFDHYLTEQKKKLCLSEIPAHIESRLTTTLLRHCLIKPKYSSFFKRILHVLQFGEKQYENHPQNT